MGKWTIYNLSGQSKAEVHNIEYEGNDGGARTVTVSVSSPIPIKWEVTDNISYRGEIFTLRHLPQEKKQARSGTHGEAFVYSDVVFYSAIDELASCEFLDVVKEDNNIHYSALPVFSFYCETIYDIADRLQSNLDRVYTGAKKWTIEVSTDITAKIDIKPQALSFSKEKCSKVLERIVNELGVNYEYSNRTITFGAKPITMAYWFKYGKGEGLKSIELSGADDNELVTRARVYGSTRNLPNRYYNKLYKNKYTGEIQYFKDIAVEDTGAWKPLISETMYVPNLMLPMFRENGQDAYIDNEEAIAKYGLREGSVFFDGSGDDEEIYPTIENMTAERLEDLGVLIELPEGDNGNLDELASAQEITYNGALTDKGEIDKDSRYFYVWLKNIGFDINDYATGEEQISFNTGALAGRTFDIVKVEKIILGLTQYKLTCKTIIDESIQLAFPNALYQPSAGDKFALLGIDMPEVYILAAEQLLLEKGNGWSELNGRPNYTFNPEINNVEMLRKPHIAEQLKEGRALLFSDEDLGIEKSIRISSLRINEKDGSAPKYEVTLSDKVSASLADRVTQSVVESLGTNSASVSNINSLVQAYGNGHYLSKTKRDTAKQVIRFSLGAEYGEYIKGNQGANIDSEGKAEVESMTSRTSVKGETIQGGWIGTPDFAQGSLNGIGGAMYQLNGMTYAEMDYLTIRKGMNVAELLIQEYKSIGGSLVVSQANGEIESVHKWSNKLGYDVYIKNWDKNPQFVKDDFVRCQYWDFDANAYVYYWVRVGAVVEDANGKTCINLFVSDLGDAIPQVGQKLVQMGNASDVTRQGCIVITTENSLPRITMFDGINEPTIKSENNKSIYGSLEGFVDPYTNEVLHGYGLWGDNVHLTGTLKLSSTNKYVEDEISSQITNDASSRNYARMTAIPTNITDISVGTNVTQRIYDVYGFTNGDTLTVSFDWEAKGIDFVDPDSFISMQFSDSYGYISTGFRLQFSDITPDIVNKGTHTHTLTLQGKWDSSSQTSSLPISKLDNGWLYFRFDNVAIVNGYFKISNLRVNKGKISHDWEVAPEDANAELNAYKEVVTQGLNTLQSQIDGKVESWFYDYTPTLNNLPASEWTTEALKEAHIGDTFTNTQVYVDDETTPNAGKSWRWLIKDGVYGWYLISDSDATKALDLARQAKDTADGKRRVFVVQPTPPYDKGDLWVNATYVNYCTDDILKCVTPRASGASFSIEDWTKASKYTDDSATRELKEEVYHIFEVADGNFTSIQGAITNNAEQGRNILLKTNQGVTNWELSTSLDKNTYYSITKVDYGGTQGVLFSKFDWNVTASYEVFRFPLRPQFIKEEYTYHLSFDAKQSIDNIRGPLTLIIALANMGGGNHLMTSQALPLEQADGNWHHYDVEFEASASGDTNGDQWVYIGVRQLDNPYWSDIAFANLKLEQSTVATNWSAAPEDLPTTTAMESRIEQTATEINLSVDNLKDGLEATGINIQDKKIVVTANDFTIKNNSDKVVASADQYGNWSTNTLMTLNEDGTKAITINEGNNRMLKHYYPYTNQVQLEEGWNGTSLYRYYDENGVMLWQIGGAKGFMNASIKEWTEVRLYKTPLSFGVDEVESQINQFNTIGDVELSIYYQQNVVNGTPKVYATQSTNNPLNGWFTQYTIWFPIEPMNLSVGYQRGFIHYTNGVEDFRRLFKWNDEGVSIL